MRKRWKRTKGMCSCTSPRCTDSFTFSWYEQDLWTYIARFLDGKSLVLLGATSKWFNSIIMQDSVWKFSCLHDLQVPDPGHVRFSWSKLYASAVGDPLRHHTKYGSHSYTFRQQEKQIDWMRIGAFSFDSEVALLSERLSGIVKITEQESIADMLQWCGTCLMSNVNTGIWITGTMQILDARHIELFLNQGYKDGCSDNVLFGSHEIIKRVQGAYGAIFDLKYVTSKTTAGILAEYHIMRAGAEGEIVSIRISQQLL